MELRMSMRTYLNNLFHIQYCRCRRNHHQCLCRKHHYGSHPNFLHIHLLFKSVIIIRTGCNATLVFKTSIIIASKFIFIKQIPRITVTHRISNGIVTQLGTASIIILTLVDVCRKHKNTHLL